MFNHKSFNIANVWFNNLLIHILFRCHFQYGIKIKSLLNSNTFYRRYYISMIVYPPLIYNSNNLSIHEFIDNFKLLIGSKVSSTFGLLLICQRVFPTAERMLLRLSIIGYSCPLQWVCIIPIIIIIITNTYVVKNVHKTLTHITIYGMIKSVVGFLKII